MNANSPADQDFLNRLTAIVEANSSNEKFGVSELAQEAGLSRSRLYLKIKSISQKSVSLFIREIRLKKALERLQHTSLSVSEVAYEVGFSSPSYFNRCFHQYFGFPPGEAKNHNNISLKSETKETTELPSFRRKINRLKKPFVVILTFVVLLLAFYIVYENFSLKSLTGKNKSVEKSIIVLPFKNLSAEDNTQYFADGICEDILNNLTKITAFKVLSRTSSEQFRESTLSSSEIARQMKVNFLLEGSVRKQDDNVRISVQLIDARKDKHLWSENYDRQIEDIFTIQSDIAKNVANQLKTILTPKELDQIDKIYTNNKEAYSFYLEGRYYYRLRTKESFEKSIEFYNKALALDSNYCLAYAGLSDTYVTGSYFNYYAKEEGIAKSKVFALKALSIDNELAEAHATLGGIATYFDFDWVTAKKELKLAMKLNPGYYRAYKLYSEFMDVTGNKEEARTYMNKTLEFNSTNKDIYWLSYYYYLKAGNYDEALNESAKIYRINSNKNEYHRRSFNIKLRQNNIQGAVDDYKKFISLVLPKSNTELLDSIYTESGKTGVVHFAIEFELQRPVDDLKTIACYYALINEKDSALNYLEKAFENGYGNLVRIKTDSEYKNLHTEPRFIELLRKMNLADD